MWKILLTTIFLFSVLGSSAQRKNKVRKPNEVWWTIYGQTQVLPGSVYITRQQPAIGYGSGHTLVFAKKDNPEKRVWLGFDVNHIYFGRKRINDYRVFYEAPQLSFVSRFAIPSGRQVTPFIDLSAGLKLLSSFTSEDRTYGSLLFLRLIDIIDGLDGNLSGVTNHKIVEEHDRFMPVAGVAGGFWISNKNKMRGLSIKGSVNIGTASKFADYREIKTEVDTYNYVITRGGGAFFNIQLGYSFRD